MVYGTVTRSVVTCKGTESFQHFFDTFMRPRATAEDGRRQRAPYQWVIKGDIKGCFDNIDHHQLMKRVRARVTDGKVTRLIAQFLKS